MAGWDWDKVGDFGSREDAVYWYKRQGMADGDVDIRDTGRGFQVWVRDTALEGKEDRNHGRGFF